MSKQRYVQDSFWTDPYIEEITPEEKLLFLYFLTNPLCNVAGIYEIRNTRIAYETGLSVEKIIKIKDKFVKDKKLLCVDDWILLVNFAKNQSFNPNVLAGMKRIIEELPEKVKALKGFERLSHFTLLNLTILNSTQSDVFVEDSTIKAMYNYELTDEDGNPIGGRKKKVRISKEENNFLISIGFLWKDMAKKALGLDEKDIVMKNIYYPIRELYNREKWSKTDFQELFAYFFKDPKIPPSTKLAFDLCMSQKYVAQFKLAKKSKAKTNASLSADIKL